MSWISNGIATTDDICIVPTYYPQGKNYSIVNLTIVCIKNSQSYYDWTIPSNVNEGSYKIKVGSLVNGKGVEDYSDNYFSIVAATTSVVNGVCGKANGLSLSTIPTSSLCFSGTPSTVGQNVSTSPWTWTWSCVGSSGGTTTYCSATQLSNQPSITVTSPNGGENIVADSSYDIKWTYSGIDPNLPVSIILIDDAQNKTYVIESYLSKIGDGKLTWSHIPAHTFYDGPASLFTGNKFKIKISVATKDASALYPDTSNNYFTIVAPTVTPSATIITVSQIGNPTPYITGTASGVSQVGIVVAGPYGDKVYGSGLVPVANGNWSVTVSPALTPGLQYTIYVYDANNNQLTSKPLTIVPSIVVTSPNGGETWAEGTDNRITWKPSLAENQALPKIDLYIIDANGNNAITPSINRENTGWDTWTPRNIFGKFNVKICQTGTTNCDTSDNYFTIVAAPVGLNEMESQLASISAAISKLIETIKQGLTQ